MSECYYYNVTLKLRGTKEEIGDLANDLWVVAQYTRTENFRIHLEGDLWVLDVIDTPFGGNQFEEALVKWLPRLEDTEYSVPDEGTRYFYRIHDHKLEDCAADIKPDGHWMPFGETLSAMQEAHLERI